MDLDELRGPDAREFVERRVEAVLDARYGPRAATSSESDTGDCRLDAPVYDLSALEACVLRFVRTNAGRTVRAIREGVRRRAADVVRALSRLEAAGLIENLGTDARKDYHVCRERRGNGQETRGKRWTPTRRKGASEG